MLNEYFASQTVVNDSNKQLPPLAPAQHILNSISVTEQDVNDVLINLDATKASGPDQISPRLLREGAPIPVGLDSEKRIFSEKMRKERKKRGKEAKRKEKEANLMSQSYGHIRDRFRMIMYVCY